MTLEISDTVFPDLPRTIPIFPLSGVLLLPGGNLPLNVFEPRYLNLMRDALAGTRVIGMIQPRVPERMEPDDRPDLYGTGCAGRIVQSEETDDGCFLLTLNGVCRFDVAEELALENGYRRVRADYARYLGDISGGDISGGDVPGGDVPGGEVAGGEVAGGKSRAIDRERLLLAIRLYFEHQGVEADWPAIEKSREDRLITTLSMICPFTPAEKQALLECRDLVERASTIVALMEMTLAGSAARGDGDPWDGDDDGEAPPRVN